METFLKEFFDYLRNNFQSGGPVKVTIWNYNTNYNSLNMEL